MLVNKALDTKVSDEGLDVGIVGGDVGDLDFGSVWDEIHLSFSFLWVFNK